MALFKKALVLFGGYHDTAKKSPKYFNDVYVFDLENYRCVAWRHHTTIMPHSLARSTHGTMANEPPALTTGGRA